jgi:hypothetical protein
MKLKKIDLDIDAIPLNIKNPLQEILKTCEPMTESFDEIFSRCVDLCSLFYFKYKLPSDRIRLATQFVIDSCHYGFVSSNKYREIDIDGETVVKNGKQIFYRGRVTSKSWYAFYKRNKSFYLDLIRLYYYRRGMILHNSDVINDALESLAIANYDPSIDISDVHFTIMNNERKRRYNCIQAIKGFRKVSLRKVKTVVKRGFSLTTDTLVGGLKKLRKTVTLERPLFQITDAKLKSQISSLRKTNYYIQPFYISMELCDNISVMVKRAYVVYLRKKRKFAEKKAMKLLKREFRPYLFCWVNRLRVSATRIQRMYRSYKFRVSTTAVLTQQRRVRLKEGVVKFIPARDSIKHNIVYRKEAYGVLGDEVKIRTRGHASCKQIHTRFSPFYQLDPFKRCRKSCKDCKEYDKDIHRYAYLALSLVLNDKDKTSGLRPRFMASMTGRR